MSKEQPQEGAGGVVRYQWPRCVRQDVGRRLKSAGVPVVEVKA